MPDIHVHRRAAGDFRISIRHHDVELGLPEKDGSRGGVTPMELLVASLGACMELRATEFLGRTAPIEDVAVHCDFRMSEGHEDHVQHIGFTVTIPPGLPQGRRDALMRVVRKCAVHNPLHLTPGIRIDLLEEAPSAAETGNPG